MIDQSPFSEHIHGTKFQEEFQKYWHSQTDFKNANFEIISKPFRICRVSNFFKTERFIEDLKCELENYEHKRKVIDLYQFEKTDDLLNASDYCVETLHKSFQKDLAPWMERNTNIKLNKTISMSSARYYETDYLLCHDDNMSDRRIAYILYLSKGWTEEDGGALDLFDTDKHGSPMKVVKSLIPEYNSLVFFEVVSNSYHQVAEVITDDKCRWSINGWFHGPLKEYYQDKSPRFESMQHFIEPITAKIELNSWISKPYLLSSIINEIHQNVMKEPYTLLQDFFNESVYEQIADDLSSRDITWQMVGPADIRHYEIADETTLPKLLKDFYNLFKSISFFQLLWKYTGLDLVPDEKTMRPKMTIELQRWSAGCYTLLYDKTVLKDNSKDDAIKSSQLDDDSSITASIGASTSKCSTESISNTSQLKRKRVDSSPITINISHKKVMKSFDIQSDICTGEQSMGEDPEHDMDATETSSLQDEEASIGTSPSDNENDSVSNGEYTLDVIMQFHTVNDQGVPKTGETISFIDPNEERGTIIQLPALDNHLCLVYRSLMICRLQQYLNHLYEGYSYNLICSYYE